MWAIMIFHILVVVGTLLATGNTLNTVLNVEEITSIHYAVDIIEQPVSREQVNNITFLFCLVWFSTYFHPQRLARDVVNICHSSGKSLLIFSLFNFVVFQVEHSDHFNHFSLIYSNYFIFCISRNQIKVLIVHDEGNLSCIFVTWEAVRAVIFSSPMVMFLHLILFLILINLCFQDSLKMLIKYSGFLLYYLNL